MVERENKKISIERQCQLLGLNRRAVYYRHRPTHSKENLQLMRRLDELYTEMPFFGVRRMTAVLKREGFLVNHKRIERLMRVMGLCAVYPKPKTSRSLPEHQKYPYLLRNLLIERANQVWASDITYIRMSNGFLYLVAVMDWYSRFVLSWMLSNTLDTMFCVEAVNESMKLGKPEIFNSDQGSQYTSLEMTGLLSANGIKISMDGRGRCHDNIFIERLWRAVKYEEVYLKDYASGWEAEDGLSNYFQLYNYRRPHQSLNYRTPSEVFAESIRKQKEETEKEKKKE